MRRSVALATAVLATILGGFALLAPLAVDAKSACLCRCIPSFDPVPQWTNLTAGNNDCRADCSEMCGGTANLQDPNTGGRLVDVSCIPESNDCSVGAFSIYKGVSCVLRYDAATADDWPETSGMRPACIVPPTAENANLECAFYGGIAKSGTACGGIGPGEDPNSYYKSRPQLGATGVDFNQNFPSLQSWQNFIEQRHPSNEFLPTDGICYRYGVLYGVEPQIGLEATDDGFTITGQSSKQFVCLKKKQNTCGTVTPPLGQYGNLPGRSYSCQRQVDVDLPQGANIGQVCFGGTDLCAASPGTRCCQGGPSTIGECLLNSECSVDGSRICSGGKCIVNAVCDPFHNQPVPANMSSTPWLIDQRRCRYASDVEKANPSICSPESPAVFRCANTGQSCCRAANPAVISGCAADFVLEAGPGSAFASFTCIPFDEIPESQYMTLNGDRSLVGYDRPASDWNSGINGYNANGTSRHCLTTTVPRLDENGRVIGSVPRCGSGSLCCNAPRLAQLGGAQSFDQVDRRPLGSSCGPGGSYTCRSFSQMLPPNDQAAMERGFATPAAYLLELARHSGCQITPFDPNLPTAANKECVASAICCDAAIPAFASLPCQTDSECAAEGLVCDKTLGICLNADVGNQVLPGASCLDRARAQIGAAAADQVANVNPTVPADQFTCQQIVSEVPNLNTKCLPPGAGCGAAVQGLNTVQCCIPGTGIPAAAAAQQSATAVVPPAAPFSLQLPACIKAGNCTLDDIVTTGANFANFLLQIVGAVFLAIFVYGGFKYLTAGTSNRAQEARGMLITAAKAIVLIMAAYVFVHFVESSLVGGRNPGQGQTCTQLSTPETSYACQFLVAPANDSRAVSEEITRRTCQRGRCGSSVPDNYVCCPQ